MKVKILDPFQQLKYLIKNTGKISTWNLMCSLVSFELLWFMTLENMTHVLYVMKHDTYSSVYKAEVDTAENSQNSCRKLPRHYNKSLNIGTYSQCWGLWRSSWSVGVVTLCCNCYISFCMVVVKRLSCYQCIRIAYTAALFYGRSHGFYMSECKKGGSRSNSVTRYWY